MALAFGINSVRFRQFVSYGLGAAFAFFTQLSIAQSEPQLAQEAEKPEVRQPLVELGDDYHNSIKLLQNRFRIDYQVDEITMVFFREFGSAPIVLVRPDGSKIFQSTADEDKVNWYDSTTFDLISIKDPTPGPWQAVGQILPDSRVMVISDIRLEADPLPEVLFSGEILKQTAYLTNAGEPIDRAEFRDVVSLEIKFVSTNNPNFNNFGAEAQTIATFQDNGRGMDETPLDGVFTGQFNLSVANGEWKPVFIVSTPMLTREQVDPPINLYPNPIKIDMIEDGGGDGYHKLIIDAQREYVDMQTLLIDGKVRFPNGDVQNFSLTEQTPDAREYLVVNYEAGVYRIKLTAYGNTKSGRDFILDVPEFTYLVEEPEPLAPAGVEGDPASTEQTQVQDNVQSTNNNQPTVQTPQPSSNEKPVEEEMSSTLFWGLIIGINLFIFIVGLIMIWLFLRPSGAKKHVKVKTNKVSDKQGMSWFSKIKSRLVTPKQPSQPEEAKPKEKEDAGIVDLSLPKDKNS